MLRIPLVLLVVCVLAARSAWAAPGGGGMDFGPSPAAPPSAPTPAAPPPAAEEGAVVDEVASEIRALATWPDRAGLRAAESLLLRGAEVVPGLVVLLSGSETAGQPGAAWVLGHLGEPAHIQVILRAAAQRTNGSRAEDFFEAAWNLDADKTKHWLFSFLTLNRPVFREKAAAFLAEHVGPEDRARVLNLLDAEKPGVRMAGLSLLEPAGIEDAAARLIQALADLDSDVARHASVLLALRADDALLARLNAVVVEGAQRERAYATLALAEVVRTRDSNPFEVRTLSELAGSRGLLHPERLSRAAAAVGLAYGVGDTANEALQSLLDRTVVDVLVDTIAGPHFRDFSSLADPVFGALRRLSGIDLPATATKWATWWQGERERFQARRPLAAFAEKDVPLARLAFETVDADGRRRQVSFSAESGPAAPGDLLLEVSVFVALARALAQAGLFEAEPVRKPRADEHLFAALYVGNQSRRMAIPAGDERHALLRMRLDSIVEANRWQRFRDVDRWPDARAWWKANVETMAQADPAIRGALLRTAVVHAFDDLPGDVERSDALDLLEDLQAGEGSGRLTTAQARELVKAAAAVAFGAVEERAVRLALAQDDSPAVRTDLTEALAGRSEPAAAALLAELLVAAGPATVREVFGDPRASMRVAAARAAKSLLDRAREQEPASLPALGEQLRPGLEVLAGDADARVVVAASVGLHDLGDPEAVARLETLYKEGDLAVKTAVAEGLGDVDAESAYPLLNLLLATERDARSGALRATALASLARTKHANAVNLLTFYLLNDADGGVRRAAGDALVLLGSDDARFAIVRALTEGQPDAERRERLIEVLGAFEGEVVRQVLTSYLEDQEARVAGAAALALGRQNVGTVVPYLIAMVRAGDPERAVQAVRALEDLTLVRLDMAGHGVVAEQYEQWYRTARITAARDPDRAWLRDALRSRGYDIGPLTPYVAGEADPVAVPVLVRALRDDDPLLRRGAALALTRITGLSFGPVTRATSQRDAIRVADQWARWWEKVGGGAGGR